MCPTAKGNFEDLVVGRLYDPLLSSRDGSIRKGKGFDVVFDTVGRDVMDRSFRAAGENGTVVTIAARSTHDLSPLHAKGLTLHAVFMPLPLLRGYGRSAHGDILRRVARLVEDGELKPLVDGSMFGFEEVGKAHSRLEAGQAMGKIALVNRW